MSALPTNPEEPAQAAPGDDLPPGGGPRRYICLGFLLIAACALIAYLWPVDRERLTLITDSGGKFGFINSDGRLVIKPRWGQASQFDSEGIAMVTTEKGLMGDRVGWIDRHDRVVIKPEWSLIDFGREVPLFESEFNEFGLIGVRHSGEGGAGWINRKGEEVVPLKYDAIRAFNSHGLAVVVKDGKFGWVNTKGEMVVQPEWDAYGSGPPEVYEYFLGRYIEVEKNNRWGVLDLVNTEVVCDPVWDDIGEVDDNGMVSVLQGAHWGWYSCQEGGITSPPAWHSVRAFDSRGMAPVRKGSLWGWVSMDGRVIEPTWASVGQFDEGGMASVSKDGLWGWVDMSGKVVIDPVWDSARDFDSMGIAPVSQDGRWGWVDRQGQVLQPPTLNNVSPSDSQGWLHVTDGIKVGWADRDGNVMVPFEWDAAQAFDSSGMARVVREGKWGWIDREGKVVIDLKWEIAEPFSNWSKSGEKEVMLAKVRIDGDWGALNTEGELVVAPEWESHWVTVDESLLLLRNSETAKAAIFNTASGRLTGVSGPISQYDENGYAWRFSWRAGLVGLVDREGASVFSLPNPAGNWWPASADNELLVIPFGSDLREYMMHFAMNHNQDLYAAKKWDTELSWSQQVYYKLKQLLGGDGSTRPEGRVLCHAYNKDGHLVWSSSWVQFGTKCYSVIAIALLGAFITRPKKKGRKRQRDEPGEGEGMTQAG